MVYKTYIFENSPDKAKRHEMLTSALREHIGADSAEIFYTPKGKPYTKGLANDIYISVTTTGEVMVCVFADSPVGIDGEYLPRFNDKKTDYLSIAERFFTDEEADYVREGDGDPQRFVKIWVRKEAFSKYTGKGLSDFSNFSVSDGDKLLNKVGGVPIKKFSPAFPGASDYLFVIAGDVEK
ncbi:MAG: 4-phosphopantetheinyl transferase family protein [Clostridia bacterium]|nr:4-phosphopantetheinyl transferase family protein [Clostridia bacterium]